MRKAQGKKKTDNNSTLYTACKGFCGELRGILSSPTEAMVLAFDLLNFGEVHECQTEAHIRTFGSVNTAKGRSWRCSNALARYYLGNSLRS